jgi:hypothetical protein
MVRALARLRAVEQQAIPFDDAGSWSRRSFHVGAHSGSQTIILSLSWSWSRLVRSGSNSDMGRGCSRRGMLDATTLRPSPVPAPAPILPGRPRCRRWPPRPLAVDRGPRGTARPRPRRRANESSRISSAQCDNHAQHWKRRAINLHRRTRLLWGAVSLQGRRLFPSKWEAAARSISE